jgi:8-oxo-dGTP pyrophosphatase MutT (NUDIX family)
MKKIIPKDAVLLPPNAKAVFKGEIFDVYQWPQTLFDGSQATFEMLKRDDTATTIGVVDGKILVIDDEQPYSGSRKSLPGGRVDETDATILEAAQREMKEETGYSFTNWRLLKVRQPYRKSEWFVYVWLAWGNPETQERHLDPGEIITVSLLDFEKFKALIDQDVDYLSELRPLFKNLPSLEALMSLTEFQGQEVDR